MGLGTNPTKNIKKMKKTKADIIKEQLGMSRGMASGRLRKSIMFDLVQRLSLDICFKCKKKISLEKELSIEHKEPWLHNIKAVKLFFDLENIAFSHLKCNISSGRRPTKKEHGTKNAYERGCRCKECREAKNIKTKNNRIRRKERTGKSR